METPDVTIKKVPVLVSLAIYFPHSTFLLFLLSSLFLSFFALQFLELSDPTAGLRLRNAEEAHKADGWLWMLTDLRPESSSKDTERQITQSTRAASIDIMFFAKDNENTVFTLENLQQMQDLVDELKSVSGFEDVCRVDVNGGSCKDFESPLHYFENATTQQEIEDGLRAMWLDLDDPTNPTLQFFGSEFNNETNLVSAVTRIKISFGMPLVGYLNNDDREDEQEAIIDSWIASGSNGADSPSMLDILQKARSKYFDSLDADELKITYLESNLFWTETNEVILGDVIFAGGSFLTVLLFIWFHTKSFFLAAFGLVQILLSFPVCFFIYRLVLDIEMFNGMNIISLYLLIGIGVDDLLVYFDALSQSFVLLESTEEYELTFEKRLAWAFSRARFTIFATSMTTSISFFMLVFVPVPIVRYFGILTGMLVLTDYFLVCTFYTTCLVLHHKYFSCRSRKNEQAIVLEKEIVAKSEDGQKPVKELRLIERWFRDYFSVFISKATNRYVIFTFFGAMFVAFTASAFNLEPEKEGLFFWPDDHPYWYALKSDLFFFNEFNENSVTSVERVHLVFGVDSPYIDRSGTDETNPVDVGETTYASRSKFDLSNAEYQLFLSEICPSILERVNGGSLEDLLLFELSDVVTEETQAVCFMRAFQLWREARGQTFPFVSENSETALENFTLPVPEYALSPIFEEEIAEFLGRPYFSPKFSSQLAFERLEDSFYLLRIKAATFEFRTTLTEDDPLVLREKVVSEWDSVLEEIQSDEEGILDRSSTIYYTGASYFVTARLQQLLFTNTFTSVAIGMVVAFVFTTLATKNFILGLLTMVPIAGTVACVLGTINLLGWQLGAIEASNAVIIIGISVDYIIHLNVAYAEGATDKGYTDRYMRTEHALVTLGTSVLFGAITTLVASIFLLFATITFFSKFGTLFVSTIFFAFLWGLIMFPAMLMHFGPQNDDGEVGNYFESFKHSNQIQFQEREKGDRKKIYGTFIFVLAIVLVASFVVYSIQVEAEADDEDDSITEIDYLFFLDNETPVAFDSLETGVWTEIQTGDDTVCSRGTPYSFFVRKGDDPSNVIIEFEGGGACWSETVCSSSTGTFKETIEENRAFFNDVNNNEDWPFGLKDPNGPYASFTYIFIPYCTGDLHWGDKSVQYTENLFIRHKGAVNAGKAINWFLDEVTPPERILTTGCSAGAYGSWLWTNYISEELGNETMIFQMADSGFGVISSDFLIDGFSNWGVSETGFFPVEIFDGPIDLSSLSLPDLYNRSATAYPDTKWGQFTSAYDWNQAFFFKVQVDETVAETRDLRSEDKEFWKANMTDLYQDVFQDSAENLYHLIIPGDFHCSIVGNRYFSNLDGRGNKLFRTIHDFWQREVFPEDNVVSCDDFGGGTCEIGVDLRDEIKLL
eukprot:augustus_masked-scaffold_5-processed-gene-14.15-mRNA-1 protein AED:1.00 eAED:1.00 QI:0/-1/0/0/-1/1/1/0/1398